MSRIAYVNGRYRPHRDATVHIEDRGYQFADGVYEVCEVKNGRLVDARRHIERLDRSLAELRIAKPMSNAALNVVLHETARRNRVGEGIVYPRPSGRHLADVVDGSDPGNAQTIAPGGSMTTRHASSLSST